MLRQIYALLIVLLCTANASADSCTPFIEDSTTTPAFRAHTNTFEHCSVSEETYRRIIRQWLDTAQRGSQITSMYLGRAVDYPWISRQIADNAVVLIHKKGPITNMPPTRRYALESAAIKDPALLGRLAAPFADSSFRVTGISFEKVLYGKASDCSTQKDAGKMLVPYDAQLWIRLESR